MSTNVLNRPAISHALAPNRLYFGDNLNVLRTHIADASVDLCYIDPPFNSKRNYNQIYSKVGAEDQAQAQAFVDTWIWDTIAEQGLDEILGNEKGRFTPQTIDLIQGFHNILRKGSLFAYLVSMTLRITEICRVLKPTGSFYVHCDPTVSHYLKLLMDAVFTPMNFRNEIIWQRTLSKSLMSRRLPQNHDVLLSYAKSEHATWNMAALFNPYDPLRLNAKTANKYRHRDPDGRVYQLDNLINPNPDRPNLTYEFLGVTKVWRWTKARMQAAYEAGFVVQTKPGAVPRLKRYLDKQRGRPLGDMWIDIPPINSQAIERIGYPTQKPQALLERIIKLSSHEGDIILDAYCGCGTTVAVAQKMKRHWIGIDITYQSISLILKRLEDAFGSDVLNTIALDGIPKDIASARALAHKKDDRVRKEFEKWAILTYSNNRATINYKKGADHGIDGMAHFRVSHSENARIVFQAKSGHVGEKEIRDLLGAMTQERAALGIFITLREPTTAMVKTARAAGTYRHALMQRTYDKIQIVTIRDMLEHGTRLDMPLTHETIKRAGPQDHARQLEL